jgi:hypothetical protein
MPRAMNPLIELKKPEMTVLIICSNFSGSSFTVATLIVGKLKNSFTFLNLVEGLLDFSLVLFPRVDERMCAFIGLRDLLTPFPLIKSDRTLVGCSGFRFLEKAFFLLDNFSLSFDSPFAC